MTAQLVAVEQAGLTNCCPVQVNKRLIGGGYGVDLSFIPGSFVYQVAIIDIAEMYAGATVPNLNGATPAALDIVLFKPPTRGVGIAIGDNVAQVCTAIVTNPYWSSEERQAMLSVMNVLGSLLGDYHATGVRLHRALRADFGSSRYRSGVLLSHRKELRNRYNA